MTNNKRRKKVNLFAWIGWIISLAVIVGMVYLVPFNDIVRSLSLVDPIYFFLAFLTTGINLALRGKKWAMLFLPKYKIRAIDALAPVNIGLAVNGVLPGKVGEFVRVALGVKMFKTSYAFTTVTLIGDRLLDALTLLLFLGLSILALPSFEINSTVNSEITELVSPEALVDVIWSMSAMSILLLLFIIGLMITTTRNLLLKVVKAIPVIGKAISNKADHIFSELNEALMAFREFKIVLSVSIQSILVWLVLAVGTYLLSFGFEGLEMNFFQALVITSISIASAAIPSAPGGWGIFEAGTVLAIRMMNIQCDDSTAIAYAFAMHFAQYLAVMGGGIVMMFVAGISKNELKNLIKNPKTGDADQ